MATDLELIKELEQEVGKKLRQRDFKLTLFYREPCFATDDRGRVTGLNLNGMKLDVIPAALARFRHLEKFSLDNNRISDVAPLAGMTSLNILWLNNNQINDAGPLTGLSNLKRLALKNNKIAILTEEILDLDMEFDVEYKGPFFKDKLYLSGNPLKNPPPEIIKQGKSAMRAYFRELAKEKQLPLREAKILLVGDGGAGKTSLVKCLLGRDFDANESQTHGINIDAWQVQQGKNEIKAHLWDFGGQEIMHATHQFFLSKRSLYVLVLDGRRDEKTEYWLKHIESFGGDSPVLVALNKMDENPGHDLNRNFLRQKYKNIRGFFRLSCADNEAKRIYIYVTGKQQRDYFAALLLTLRRINESFEKLKTKELIPMPDDPEITVSYMHLLFLEEKGITVYIPDGSQKEYNVADLLGTVRPKETGPEAILKLLQRLADKTDTVESLLKKAQEQDVFSFQPSIGGVSVDLKALTKKALTRFHKKKK